MDKENHIYVFGNTTVRSALRFPDGLKALEQSKFNGNLNSAINEQEFSKILNEQNIVQLKGDDASLARKWRSAFDKNGFIVQKSISRKKLLNNDDMDPRAQKVKQAFPNLKIKGKAYEITPQGHRLAQADSIYEMQDTILRALLAVQINSFDLKGKKFKPFVFVLQVLKELSLLGERLGLNRSELLIVSSVSDHRKVKEIAAQIIKYRKGRDAAVGKQKKAKYDRHYLSQFANKVGVKYDTASTYSDPNFKYMLATGLFSRQGKRFKMNQDKKEIINQILNKEPHFYENEVDYYYNLWNGYPLPTDDKDVLVSEIKRLATKLNTSLIPDELNKDVPTLKQLEIKLEKRDSNIQEKKFAEHQDDEVNIIIKYLKTINGEIKEGEEYQTARDDMPTFFEWATWRAFLAIDGLKNSPDEARGFKVDQDFYPVNNAPAGCPDIVLEFDNYVLIVEVTLTTTSRQEAAEAEPVRRHIAFEQEKYPNKPVYGLFLARSIDNNTAEMFRMGLWYNKNKPEFINVVPLTLSEFICIMEKYKEMKFTNNQFERLIEKCLIPRNATVPLWRNEIHSIIDQYNFVNNH